MPLAQVGIIGITPLMREHSPPPKPPEKALVDKKVTLNVSGRKFQTWEYTLRKFPDSLLGSDDKEAYFIKEKNEYFFDRDPDFFRHILNFYRSGKLHYSPDDCGSSFADEMEFFRLTFDDIGLCCLEEYEAQQREEIPDEEETESEDKKQDAPKKTVRQRLWHLFEEPTSSLTGKIVYYVTGLAIVFSILTTIVETVPCGQQTCGKKHKKTFGYVDGTCVIILTIEYVVRLYAAPRRCAFVKSFMSIIDIAAIFPFYLDVALSSQELDALTVLRVFRVFRVFKVSRRSTRLQALGTSLKKSSSELGFILFSFALGVIIFSTAVYYAEKDVKGTTFASIPDGMWYAIVTMTTTG